MTRDDAINSHYGQVFYHATFRNADGSAVRVRVSGKCRTWRTRPDDFRLPVKHGLRDSFYIEPSGMELWLLEDPTEGARITRLKLRLKAKLVRRFNLVPDVDDFVLTDILQERGMWKDLAEYQCCLHTLVDMKEDHKGSD